MSLLAAAQKDLSGAVSEALDRHGLGRAHFRALSVIRDHPGLTVKALFTRLDITKQSLSRILTHLTDANLVEQRRGKIDGREKALFLTEHGAALEEDLFDLQKDRLMAAYRAAGGESVAGFWEVLEHLTGLKQPPT